MWEPGARPVMYLKPQNAGERGLKTVLRYRGPVLVSYFRGRFGSGSTCAEVFTFEASNGRNKRTNDGRRGVLLGKAKSH
jgi:hypothetical protein